MKILTLKEAQALYNVLGESSSAQEPVLIELDGRPIGVFMPIAEYEAFKAWRESESQRQHSTYDEAYQREVAAFERMKADLLRQHPNRVVAIYNGQVVQVGGENESVVDVAMRAYEQLGYVPVYVQRVEASPRIYRISSPRIVR